MFDGMNDFQDDLSIKNKDFTHDTGYGFVQRKWRIGSQC
jgi:hypothetical protein